MTQKQLIRLSQGDGQAAIDSCLSALRAGGLVVIPTETVYGVGILPVYSKALRAIKSSADRPFSLAVDSIDRLASELAPLSRPARRLAERWWPGPLTQVLADGRGGNLGVRVPDHAWTRQLLEALGEPLLLSSANRPGEPAPRSLEELSSAVREAVDVLVDGGLIEGGQASTVVATGLAGLRVLRSGAVGREELAAWGTGQVAVVCSGNTCRSPMARLLLRRGLAHLGREDSELLLPEVFSAGLHAGSGQPASAGSLLAMSARGLDLTSHVSCPLDDDSLARADVLLGMTGAHVLALLAAAAPDQAVALFDPGGHELPDPFGGSPADYEACASHLEQVASSRARSLLPSEDTQR